MMQSEEIMDNNKRLEIILKIRDIRKKINELNITIEEKEVLRKSLNYYENMLDLDIARSNLNKDELDNEDILNDIVKVDVPVEEDIYRYQEFIKINDSNIIKIIDNISNIIENLELNKDDIVVLLNSLKEYSIYLNQLAIEKQHNKELYDEIMKGK